MTDWVNSACCSALNQLQMDQLLVNLIKHCMLLEVIYKFVFQTNVKWGLISVHVRIF